MSAAVEAPVPPERGELAASGAALPGAERLRALAAREGIDTATTLLYRSLFASPTHGPFIRRVDELCSQPAPARWTAAPTLVIVPGAFYRENPASGADGRFVREEAECLGCPTEVVPLESRGTVAANGRILLDWLAARRGRPMILASLSKGGADVKEALADPAGARAFESVAAWVNLCGTLDGTPMADWLLSWRPRALLARGYYSLRGQRLAFLRDLRYREGGVLAGELRLPPHLSLISVVGFPLRQHLARGVARRCHRRLAPLGPNDGVLVLTDVCAHPGLVYPVWGADHYLQPDPDLGRRPEPAGERTPTVRALIGAFLRYACESAAWRGATSGAA